jgi:O-antigen/teichoic acid export membrane protein
MKKRIQYIKNNFLKHELVSGSLFIFSGSIFGNFLAFILNLFLARSLSYSDYAIFASLLSVITLAAIPSNSIGTVIAKFATEFFVKKQYDKLKILYILFFKFVLSLSLLIILLFLIFSVPLKNYLHIDNVWYVSTSGVVIASFYLSALNGSFLQSLLKFKFMALANVIGSILKLSVGVILVILGYRAFGGLGGLFSMMFAMYLAGYLPLAKILKEKLSDKKISLDAKQIFSYAAPAFTTILFLTSFISVDVILVKHFFNPHLAGYYSGLSLMGKVIYYFTFPIPLVMFPLLVKRHANGVAFNNLFYLALILVILPSIAITVFYFIFPNFVINLFLGGREYLYVAPYLGIFGLYLTVFSLVNVCVNFFLSLNKTNISIPVVAAAISQVILIYFFHSNFYQVIGVSLFALVILLVILLYLFLRNYKNFGRFKETVTTLNVPGI